MQARQSGACWIAVGMCVVILAMVSVERLSSAAIDPAPYLDTDTYSRMVRVVDLWTTGDWYDAGYDRIYPDGLESHWTRPLDAAIVALAVPLTWFMDDARALHWAGWFIAPLLSVLCVALFAWSLRPLMSGLATVFTALSLLFVLPVLASFLPGRPDHYPPLILLFGVVLWGLVRLFTTPSWRSGAIAVGVALPLVVWVNITGSLLTMMVPVALGVRWLVSGEDWARRNQWVGVAATVACLIALFVEHPPSSALTTVEFDRLSQFHLVLFLVIALFWTGVRAVERKWPTWSGHGVRRAASAIPLAVVGLVILLAAYPQVMAPDRGIAIDPLYEQARLIRISEYQPVIRPGDLESAGSALRAVAMNAGYILPFVMGVLGLLVLLIRADGAARWVWGTLAGLAAGYLLAMWPPVLAWMTLIMVILAPGVGVVVAAVFAAFANLRPAARIPLRVVATAGVMLGPIMVQSATQNAYGVRPIGAIQDCGFSALGDWLAEAVPAEPRLRIMAVADMGAELMYRTPHMVYAIPNHRRQRGFDMTWHVMSATTPDGARKAMQAADADLLIVCDTPAFRLRHPDIDEDETFRARLLSGAEPAWLTPMDPPESVPGVVRVYRVTLDGTGG